jgi:AcrR family transcriptional regulator
MDEQRRLRSRPDKAPLSLDAFTAAAIGLLDREGGQALTLRRVARELETGPASLYAYVRTLQELHALVVDRVLAEVKLHEALSDSPRERLEAILTSYLSVMFSREGLGELAAGVLPYGDNTITLTDTIIGCLRQLGMSPARAAWGYDLLALQVTAVAAEQDRRRRQDDPKGRARTAYEKADPDRHTNIDAVRDSLFTGGASRFSWAVNVLLTGIAAAPEPTNKPHGGPAGRRQCRPT